MSAYARTVWEIYRWPLFLALVIMVGLLSALLGDGIWNGLSWLLLALPLLLIAGCLFGSRRHKRQ